MRPADKLGAAIERNGLANARALHQMQLDVSGPGGVATAITSLETRMDTTEDGLELSARDRAHIFAGLGDAEDLAAEGGLRAILEQKGARKLIRKGIAEAREDLTVKVSEGQSAEAARRLELSAAFSQSISLVTTDMTALSTDTQALAQSLVTLQADLGAAGSNYTSLAQAIANEASARVAAVQTLEGTVGDTTAKINSVLGLAVTGATAFGQWYNQINATVYNPETGLEAAHGLIASVYSLDLDDSSVLGQWYSRIEGDLYDENTGFAAVSGLVSSIYSLDLDPGSVLGQWYNRIEGDLYNPETGFAAVSGLVSSIYSLDLDPGSVLGQWYNKIEGDLYNEDTGLAAVSGLIAQIVTLNLTPGTALAQWYDTVQVAVFDPVTGIAKAHAELTAIKGLAVSDDTVLGQFKTRTEAQIGGNGANLVPDNRISTLLYWVLGAGWTLNDNSALAGMNSRGELVYTVAANPGAGWGSEGRSWEFPVHQQQVYTVAAQIRGSAACSARLRIRWEDKDGVFLSHDTLTITTTSTGIQPLAGEFTAPVHARTATVRAGIDRDTSSGVVRVGGITVQRISEGLTKTRGHVDDIINFDLDENSVLFEKLTGVTTEVFGPGGADGLKASTGLLLTSVDGMKLGASLRLNNNGHISGLTATSDLADGVGAQSALLFAADKIFFMGEIYGVGTVNVRNGSKDVSGTGTGWLGNVSADDWFTGPDGRTYRIATIGGNGALILQKTYKGQTDTGETYGIAPAYPLLSVYGEDTVEGGVTIPKGVYIDTARVKKADIFDLAISNKIESSNYTEDGNGLPTAGFRIRKDGTLKTAGIILSRNIVAAEGSFDMAAALSVDPYIGLYTVEKWDLIPTGVNVPVNQVWMASNKTYLAYAAFEGAASAVGGITGDDEFWGCTATVQPFARWNGPQQLYLRIELHVRGITALHSSGNIALPGKIHWKLYEVT